MTRMPSVIDGLDISAGTPKGEVFAVNFTRSPKYRASYLCGSGGEKRKCVGVEGYLSAVKVCTF
jgi:hypothetical protein